MDLRIHTVHFDADQKLIDYIHKKFGKLSTFNKRIIDGEVILKLEKKHLNKNEVYGNKILELKINIPGEQLFTKESSSSFEATVDSALETMSRLLKKKKDKRKIRKSDVRDLTN